MSILVVGSVALDTVKTPYGEIEDALGGAATYFAAAASYFAQVNLVGVVGDDFDHNQIEFLKSRNVDLTGLERQTGKTFRWGGVYSNDMNDRETTFTHLNVFESFSPKIPESYRDSEYIFLANIAPELQLDVLKQVHSPKLVALDTMNFWIEGALPALQEVLGKVDILLINDSEAKQLAGENNLVKAARAIHKMGPKTLIIKKGEHGALLIPNDMNFFVAPAYPLETVFDPTGAGDTFAGGFMGYLARTNSINKESLSQALIAGSAMASLCVEKFSLERLKDLTGAQIHGRVQEFSKMMHFDADGAGFNL